MTSSPVTMTSSNATYTKHRWVILSMCVSAAFLDYATRTNINNAIVSMVTFSTSANDSKTFISDFCPSFSKFESDNVTHALIHQIDQTYDWDPATQGAILGAFFYGYIIPQIPSGRLAEIFGGKWIVFVGILGSGIINLLTPIMSQSVPVLITSRVVLGLVQGGVYPAMFTLIINWMKPEEKSPGVGLCHVGGNLGVVTAAAITGFMSQHLGWKSSFYAIGAIGIFWTLIWLLSVKSAPSQTLSDAESSSEPKPATSLLDVPWLKIIKNKSVLGCIAGRFGASLAYLTLQTKLPGYLKDILHIEPSINGLLNALVYVSACISMTGGSYLSEIFISRNWLSRTNTRKFFSCFGLYVCCICFCCIPQVSCNIYLAMVLLVIGISCYGLTAGGDMIIPAEMTKKYPSTIYSLVNMCANIAGTIAPIFIGQLLNSATSGIGLKHSWDKVFYLVAIIVAITTTLFLIFASAEYQTDIDGDIVVKKLNAKDGNHTAINNLTIDQMTEIKVA